MINQRSIWIVQSRTSPALPPGQLAPHEPSFVDSLDVAGRESDVESHEDMATPCYAMLPDATPVGKLCIWIMD